MDPQKFEVKKLEYQMAQEMLRHYDALNWQIGSVLIAAVLILTGFVSNKDVIDFARADAFARYALGLGIPFLSFLVLLAWFLWFRRHRILYNFRNEVLQRIELEFGMFHHLRVVEADIPKNAERLADARSRAGHDAATFEPFYPLQMKGPSGYNLAKALMVLVPLAQLFLLAALYKMLPLR